MVAQYGKVVDRIPWDEKKQSSGLYYLRKDELTIYCGDKMFVPDGAQFDWLDERSLYLFMRQSPIAKPHSEDPYKRFCDTPIMTTLMDNQIRQPSLLPGERTAVIVICPVMLDMLPAPFNRRPTGSLDLALQRSELTWNTFMDDLTKGLIVSPPLFHELFHVAADLESNKQPLSIWHSNNEHGHY
jgi:hypothetical protein